MLSSLREKLLNVTLFASHEEKTSEKGDKLNLNAGADILQHFQTYWEELHKNNEENAKEANKVADEIQTLSDRIQNKKQNISLITHILTNSNLPTNMVKCSSAITNLYKTSESIENNLIKLERIIDETEFENMKVQHRYHLTNYDKRKAEAFQNLSSNLEEAHVKKIAEYEASKKAMMAERQKVYQNAFKNDLELYKNMGSLPHNQQQGKSNGAMLEEIQIDFDQSELDQFFNDKIEDKPK